MREPRQPDFGCELMNFNGVKFFYLIGSSIEFLVVVLVAEDVLKRLLVVVFAGNGDE